MDGKAYLEDLIEQRIRDATTESDRPQRFGLAHIEGVASGLVAAGVLPAATSAEVLNALRGRLTEQGLLTRQVTSSDTSTAYDAPSGTIRTDRSDEARSASYPHPVDLSSLIGQRVVANGVPYDLISLERWTSMFVVRYVHIGSSMTRRPPTWSAADEQGNVYRPVSGGAHGDSTLLIFEQRFRPALVNGARSLYLTADGDATSTVRIAVQP